MSVRNGTVLTPGGWAVSAPPTRRSDDDAVLDVAAATLVADPSAALGAVAAAAGIGRTTLHTKFATRHDLLVAVAERALDLCDEAVTAAQAKAADSPPADGLHHLLAELVPLGCHLAFLLRQPEAFDHSAPADRVEQLASRVAAFVRSCVPVPATTPDWWLATSLHALVYSAWDAVVQGWLAPRDASSLVASTYLDGIRFDPTGART